MKKCELKKAITETLQIPAVVFALGAFCGLAVGMLCLPFSKGIVIGSYNKSSCEKGDSVAESDQNEGKRKLS